MNEDPYDRRIAAVIEHIGSHLDEDLSLEELCAIACCSKFHFHRLFTAQAGLPLAQFVRLTRLKRACYQLAFAPSVPLIDIALQAGFSTPESFARAFRDTHGQTPSAFRSAPLWGTNERYQHLPAITRSNSMNPKIVDFPEMRVAVLEHRGPPETLMTSVARFIAWRKQSTDSPNATSRSIGIAYDDPDATPPQDFRFDICGELRGPLTANDAGIVEKIIPAGRCAVARHLGSTDAIRETVLPMYRTWLPSSGERLRDFPCFFHYIARMPTVQEHEQVTDVYLPIV